MTRASTAAHNVLKDLKMLAEGTWVPDEGSIADSITNAELVCESIKKYERRFVSMRQIAGEALND